MYLNEWKCSKYEMVTWDLICRLKNSVILELGHETKNTAAARDHSSQSHSYDYVKK